MLIGTPFVYGKTTEMLIGTLVVYRKTTRMHSANARALVQLKLLPRLFLDLSDLLNPTVTYICP
jgi:hypothetical protein